MLDELQTYQQWIEKELEKPIKEELREYHKQKILEFQHERLIHLLVTLTIGIALLISVFATLFTHQFFLYILDGLFFLLFIPYIFHYRGLENGVQGLYKITDKLYKKSI